MKKMTKRMALAFLMASFVSAGTAGAVISQNFANAEEEPVPVKTFAGVDISSFAMANGADICIGKGGNGLRFTAEMDTAAYEALETKGAAYGMLIVPQDYLKEGYELTKENVFNNNKFFFTEEPTEEDVAANRKSMINITYEALSDTDGNGKVDLSGSIINLYTANIYRKFVAVAYVSVSNEETGVIDYEFAEYYNGDIASNACSIYRVAQAVLDSTDKYTADVKNTAQTEFFDAYNAYAQKKGWLFGYNLKYVLEKADGTEEVLSETTEKGELNSHLSVGFNDTYAEYYYLQESATDIKLYAHNETAVEIRYKEIVKTEDNSLHRITGNETYDLAPAMRKDVETKITVQRMVGTSLVAAPEVSTENNVLSNLSVGAYKVTYSAINDYQEIVYHTCVVDYDTKADTYVYLNNGNENLNDYVIHRANWGNMNGQTLSWVEYAGNTVVKLNVAGESKSTWEAHVIPVHSKAYYEALATDTAYEHTFKYDFIVNPTGDAANTHTIVDVFQKDTNTTRSDYKDATVYTRTLTMKQILDNWDNLMDVSMMESDSNRYAAYEKNHLLYVKGSGVFDPYIGNFRVETEKKTLKTDWTEVAAICANNNVKKEQMTLQTNWADNQYGLTIWCSAVTNPLDKTGTYLKLINPESKDPIKWNVKNYYYTSEDLAALITKEGALTAGEYKLTFEAYVEDTASSSYKMWQYVVNNGSYAYTDSATITANQWYTIEIDLAAYLSYEASGKKPYIFSTNSKTVTAYYLGNMKLEQGAVKNSAAMSLTQQVVEEPEEKPLAWNEEISMANYGTTWKCFQWTSGAIGSTELALTTVAGKEGTFITNEKTKSAISMLLFAAEEKAYYEELLSKGNYKLVYEACLTDFNETTKIGTDTKAFYYKSDYTVNGVSGTYAMQPYYWYTVEIDLNCLVTNFDTPRIFYANMSNGRFYLGNIRLVEGTIEGSSIPMKYIKGEAI